VTLGRVVLVEELWALVIGTEIFSSFDEVVKIVPVSAKVFVSAMGGDMRLEVNGLNEPRPLLRDSRGELVGRLPVDIGELIDTVEVEVSVVIISEELVLLISKEVGVDAAAVALALSKSELLVSSSVKVMVLD
jgi:hypothetical protein